MELHNWCRNYVNDEQTKKIFGEWANYIAEQKGIRKGYQQGMEEGILQDKFDIAKNMLTKKMNINDIHEITGLSLEELDKLNSQI